MMFGFVFISESRYYEYIIEFFWFHEVLNDFTLSYMEFDGTNKVINNVSSYTYYVWLYVSWYMDLFLRFQRIHYGMSWCLKQ